MAGLLSLVPPKLLQRKTVVGRTPEENQCVATRRKDMDARKAKNGRKEGSNRSGESDTGLSSKIDINEPGKRA